MCSAHALAAADDDDIRLLIVAESGLVLGFLLRPGQPVFVGPVLDAFRSGCTAELGLFVAFQLLQGGEQGPALAVLQASSMP